MLDDVTYMVRHCPNCPKRFELRTCGDAPCVAMGDVRNLVSYGDTLHDAMVSMVGKMAVHYANKRRKLRKLRSGEISQWRT